MNAFLAPQQATFTASSLTELEECSDVSVYAPGYIQPYGVLLTLQEPDLTILQMSENVETLLGVPVATLLGQPLQHLFPRAQVKQIADFLQQEHLEHCNPFELKTRVKDLHPQPLAPQGRDGNLNIRSSKKGAGMRFRGSLHRTTHALILELEPQPSSEKTQASRFYQRLQAVTLSLRSATSLAALAQTLAGEIKALTGFDRVMVYRFEADDHGVVIAEAKENHLESYLGLHYPAIDIPVPARKLFLRNWTRHIPDVNYTPAYLLSLNDTLLAEPLDLSDCVLRGVSPYHIEYLQNMGVSGTLTIALVEDQRLWGLIACHHSSSKLVDYEMRKTCEFLGQFASIELVHQQARALKQYRLDVSALKDSFQDAFLREPNYVQQILTSRATELLKLVHAEGLTIALDQTIALIGQTPPLEAVQELLICLPQLNQHEIYLTDCLTRLYPSAKAFKHVASGMLAISIVLNQKSYYLLWFRPEQVQTVSWAGNPQTATKIDDLGNVHLCPRKSFALWKETVQETSRSWQSPEIDAALMMRNTLMLAVLESRQH